MDEKEPPNPKVAPLVYPLVFWNQHPPTVPVSCSLLSRDGSRMVTGDITGGLVIWLVMDHNKDGNQRVHGLQSYVVVTGFGKPIVQLCECDVEDGAVICSLNTIGTLTIHSIVEGSCLGVHHKLVPHATGLVVLPGRRHIVISSSTTHMFVMDVVTQKIVTSLNSLMPVMSLPLSLRNLTPPNIYPDIPSVFISLSEDRSLQYWDVGSILQQERQEHFCLYNIQVEGGQGPVLVCDQTSDCDVVMLVFSKTCLLYLYRSKKPFLSLDVEEGKSYSGGQFFQSVALTLFQSDGHVQMYSLPNELLDAARRHRMELCAQDTKAINLLTPKLNLASEDPQKSYGSMSWSIINVTKRKIGLTSTTTNQRASMPSSTQMTSPVTPLTPSTYSLTEIYGEDDSSPCEEKMPIQGVVCNYAINIDPSCGISCMSTCTHMNGKVAVIATNHQIILWNFPEIGYEQINTSNQWPGAHSPPSNENLVTASLYSVEQMYVVSGFISGKMTVTWISGRSNKTWQGHISRITSLLLVSDYLVSGSEDGSVKVWTSADLDFCHQFHHHTSSISHLIPLPEDITNRTSSNVCSISDDRSIIMYSLTSMEVERVMGGHSGDIIGLYWLLEWDCALVSTSDGWMTIWQVSPGVIQRVVPISEGNLLITTYSLKNALDSSFLRWTSQHADKTTLLEDRPVVSSRLAYATRPKPTPNFYEVPIMIIDIRALIGQLHFASKINTSNVNDSQSIASPQNPANIPYNFDTSDPTTNTVNSSFTNSDNSSKVSLDPKLTMILAQLFEPDSHPSIDKIRTLFNLPHTNMKPSLGMKSSPHIISILCPLVKGPQVYSISPMLTALRTVSMLAILYTLISFNPEEFKVLCKECINYYILFLPKHCPGYSKPSFMWCASWLTDTSVEIKFAARCTMNAVLRSMKNRDITNLVDFLLERVKSSPVAVIALCVVVIQVAEKVRNDLPAFALESLLDLVKKGPSITVAGNVHACAVTVLSDNFATVWKPLLPDPSPILRVLFEFTMSSVRDETPGTPMSPIQVNPSHSSSSVTSSIIGNVSDIVVVDPEVSKVSMTAMCVIGEQHPKRFLDMVDDLLAQPKIQRQAHSIVCLSNLVKKCPSELYPYIFRVIGLVLKVLDPHMPNLRDYCLHASTAALKIIVGCYSMVVFQQVKQKLAVGDHTGHVIIYNMRTATKWTTWSAHEKGVSCIQFSPTGELLATYCNSKAQLKVWNCEGASVLGMPISPKMVKQFPVVGNQDQPVQTIFSKGVHINWNNNKEVQLSGCVVQNGPLTFKL